MSEYNYNYNNNNNNTEENGSNYNGFSTDSGNNNKPPKKRTGLKTAAFIMAMAIVSGGSIQAYRYFSHDSLSTTAVVDDADADDTSSTKNSTMTKLAAQNISIIEPVESDGKALSNEEIVKKVLPSVVGVESSFEVEMQSQMSIPNDFFDFGGFGGFGGFGDYDYSESEPQTRTYKGTGTGVVVSENGYIVTNAHVIYDDEYKAGRAKEVNILINDETYEAEIIGYDVDCDLAVLKIEATGLTAAEFGNSDDLQLGESVIAIGNPLGFELKNTVTGGMISGLDRDITINDKAMNLIQTDAAINSGNSGGPLINKYGQVIGINSSKMSSSYSSSGASIEGIGFAIPSNATATIIDDIMKYGYVTGKPQLGITCKGIDESDAELYNLPLGVIVKAVNEGSAAEKAGIEVGDIITKADGEKVTTSEELIAKKNKHTAGEKFELTIMRNGVEKTIVVTLDEQAHESANEDKNNSKNEEKEEKESKKNAEVEEEAEDEDEDEDEEEEEPTTKSKKSNKSQKGSDIFD
ncbi:serine protease Do [Ruminococcus flavefaciens]|uniref:Serine protease Do n=1 Tax=Ruminococcus flavefaciens TaxID=1265 RepID=A0A1H6HZV6_RUMFL|nr:trypsin-like peptidase domain-containing protein [Ruminococcus flavefaciens]SEH41910.1 serine protease Do [Ruminococcus flavefaciens]